MRIATLILIIIFILLQIDIWLKEDGKKRTKELTQMINIQQEANKEMMIKNSEKSILYVGRDDREIFDIKDKINLEVDFISKSAKEKIKNKGGSITLTTK